MGKVSKTNGAEVKDRPDTGGLPERAADVARVRRSAPNDSGAGPEIRLLVQPDTRGRIPLARVSNDVREIYIASVNDDGVITLTPAVVREERADNALKVDLALLEEIEKAIASDDGDLAHALGMARSKLTGGAADVDDYVEAALDDHTDGIDLRDHDTEN